ncbi:UNVERIFIED_CONTAM: Caffeic acid 3-O-methyltransferase [Sesamum calycinum]|uniref:Caffeic acid 3-O-methyltransferase n=1 Tax=Sesamum calycinum TaxID=2727403 RepID=A0AAW2P852_9LAMI
MHDSNNYKHGEDEEAGVLALASCVSHVFPMALDAAIQLDLFDIIARAGVGALLSPSDIASQLPASNDGAAGVLDSLLRLLATHSLLTCSVSKLESGGSKGVMGLLRRGSSSSEMRMGSHLLSFGNSLAQGLEGRSASKLVYDLNKKISFKDAVLGGANFSQRNNGKSYYDMIISNPEYGKMLNDAMGAHSTVLMRKVVKVYDGFASLGSIVDVGGGTGATLAIIIAMYPSTRGINFDLPHVLHNVPSYNGIEHSGGDMFVEVPKGDAILLKFILHNWSDEKCIKLLKNCYEALPNNGKLIVMDCIFPNNAQTDVHAKYASGMDIIMSTMLEGKERTEDEFETLAIKAGFLEFKVVCYVYGMWIMEFIKSI